jgi:hypothetical protein
MLDPVQILLSQGAKKWHQQQSLFRRRLRNCNICFHPIPDFMINSEVRFEGDLVGLDIAVKSTTK